MTTIRQCKSRQDYDYVLDMLYDYIIELNSFNKCVKLRNKKTLAGEYFYAADTLFYILYIDELPAGFAIIGEKSNCHPLADIYIEEFFIKPDYRKTSCGRQLIGHVLNDKQPQCVCFYILDKNRPAHEFWDKIFANWQYVKVTDSLIADMNTDFYFYEKKKEKKYD